MLKLKNSLFVFLALSTLSLFSCKFVNFENLEYTVSIEENQRFYESDYISIEFSYPLIKDEFESAINLQKDSSTESIDVEWDNNTCRIKPVEGWNLGKKYKLQIDAAARTEGRGTHNVFISRYFTYGQEDKLFKLKECSINEGQIILNKEALCLEFTSKVNQASFEENFTITPSVELKKDYIENKVYITPVKEWPLNTFFKWNINSIKAGDGYYLYKEYEGTFRTAEELELPQVEAVNVVSVYENEYTWQGDDLNQIYNGQAIGITFTKSMDFASVSNAITFSPSLKGDLIQLENSDGKKYVYVPSASYKIGEKYKMTISTSCTDINSLPLKFEYKTIFNTAVEFLKIEKVAQDYISGDIVFYENGTSYPDAYLKVTEAVLPNEPEPFVIIKLSFSSGIPLELQNKAEQSVSVKLIFPTTQEQPVITGVEWDSRGTTMSLKIEKFRAGTTGAGGCPIYYQVEVTGGENGIKNAREEYMEENLCITLNTSL